MNILDKIVAAKAGEVKQKKTLVPVAELEAAALFDAPCRSLVSELLIPDVPGIIAEFKRRSPSKGVINDRANIAEVAAAYQHNGASAISILTDEQFFGGSTEDIIYVRGMIDMPILRKEFIIDEYQLTEAKSIGADVILLIAACLSPKRVQELAVFAKRLGLEVLLEIHHAEELEHICEEVDIVGVNNRDLKTFTVDVGRSAELAKQIPSDKLKISESGISRPETILFLREHGFNGFLIGETFMKKENPAIAFAEFIHELKELE